MISSSAIRTATERTATSSTGVAHRVTGLLARPGDREGLLRDLVQVLTDPGLAARLGQAGRRRFAECFAPERMVQAHVELHEELLQAARSRRRRIVIPRPGRRRRG